MHEAVGDVSQRADGFAVDLATGAVRPIPAAPIDPRAGATGVWTGSELIVNKAKWNSLPPDLKAIVENACAACNVISEAWCQKNNAEAMEDLIKNQGVIAQPLPDPIVEALRAANAKIIAENVAKDPLTKKVNDSYQAYVEKFRQWSAYSESVYHSKILKG